MTTELKMLAFSVVLGFAQIIIAAQSGSKQRSIAWNLGPRDQKIELVGIPGRLERAYKNFLETFVFFAVAILIVSIAKAESNLTMYGAELYLAARILYVPAYAMGLSVVRTLIWFASVIGIVMVLCALL